MLQLVFLASFYKEECIWCLLTGGTFAKTHDPALSVHSYSCVKPLTYNTTFDLNKFTISSLENCTDDSLLMTQPLLSTPIFCDSSFYAFIKAINQTLTEDRVAYGRDYIGKFFI